MTLAVAWVRRIKDCEELIVASDSRLSGGRNIDSCAKIFSLPRSDSFLCCAGETDLTYPLAMQVYSAIANYSRGQDRSLDIVDLRSHVIKILNQSVSSITSSVQSMRFPEKYTQFLFGGYSWTQKGFKIWRLSYSVPQKRFSYERAPPWFSGRAPVIFAGDWQHKAKAMLINQLRKNHGVTPQSDKEFFFDWQPFEILRDILRTNADDSSASIGGAPQVMKIYQHMNCRQIGVFWPRQDGGQIFVSGRPILPYEKPDCWILDPDTFMTSNVHYSGKPTKSGE